MFERVAAPDYKLTEEKIQIFMRQIIKGNRYPDVLTFSIRHTNTASQLSSYKAARKLKSALFISARSHGIVVAEFRLRVLPCLRSRANMTLEKRDGLCLLFLLSRKYTLKFKYSRQLFINSVFSNKHLDDSYSRPPLHSRA